MTKRELFLSGTPFITGYTKEPFKFVNSASGGRIEISDKLSHTGSTYHCSVENIRPLTVQVYTCLMGSIIYRTVRFEDMKFDNVN